MWLLGFVWVFFEKEDKIHNNRMELERSRSIVQTEAGIPKQLSGTHK